MKINKLPPTTPKTNNIKKLFQNTQIPNYFPEKRPKKNSLDNQQVKRQFSNADPSKTPRNLLILNVANFSKTENKKRTFNFLNG